MDQVAIEWNTHKIASSRNRTSPVGKPIVMYNNPELYDTEDYRVFVTDEEALACLEECKFMNRPCFDIDIYELAVIIMEEHNLELPTTADDAITLYINLRQLFLELL